MMFGIIVGLLLGLLLIGIATEEEQKINSKLKETINNLQKDLDNANFKIEYRDNFVKQYQEEHEILLENASELRAKIEDLENNLELIKNSLTDENINIIKELSNKFGSED